MNLFGALDNLAWIWVSEKPLKVGKREIGLGPKCELVRISFSPEMRDFLIGLDAWFAHIIDFRDALAHRNSQASPARSSSFKASAAGLRARHHLGPDAYNPRDNILAGAAYLREMLDRYGWSGFLAAYNTGPARYDEHLATGRPLPPETQVYIAMLSPMIGDRQSDDRTVASFDLIAWARATLFASHPEAPPDAELPAAKVQPDRLPSVRRIVDLSALSPQSEGLFVHLPSGDRLQ